MTDENRNQENRTQRPNELSWSSDPKNVPGQHASDPKPGSPPGSPDPRKSDVEDDDATIREPNTVVDDESKRGGMGRDRDTDPGEPGAGGMGGTRGGTGGPGGAEDR